jgi:glycosyltransferase involved in cell wall biosynthesis
MDRPLPQVSLVIPAYNEERRIHRSLEEILSFAEKAPFTLEVLVVDDGSRDGTAGIARGFIAKAEGHKTRFELLQYGGNRGKGFAVAHGLRHGRGQYLAFSDTDLSAPIDQLPKLVEVLEAGADIAIASRRLPQSEVIGQPAMTRFRSHLFSIFSRLLVLPGISDTQCGFKAYRREAAHQLIEQQKIHGYTFDVEHLVLAEQRGMKVVEVPVRWIFSEGSQINGLTDSIRMFRDLLAIPKLHPRERP